MVSFIHNGSEIKLGEWGITSKLKPQNPKQHF